MSLQKYCWFFGRFEDTKRTSRYQLTFKEKGGLTILEALSATGLRSIRYAKEIPGCKQIIANDFLERAVRAIDHNIQENNVQDKVISSHADAAELMGRHKHPDK